MTFSHFLHIDRNRSQPLYRQIAEQIRVQIGEGRLPAGTQLPTVRQLADLLEITRVTAQNAYSELQSGGWVESTVGRGTFVTASPQNHDIIKSVGREMTPDGVLSDMHRISKIAGLRSFAWAWPDADLFPTDDLWSSLNNQADSLTELMQYGSPQGDDVLRIELGIMLAEQGITAVPDDIMVTNGVTQGLALITQYLAPRGTSALVEQPIYCGMLNILDVHGVQPIGVPLDESGIRLDLLEQAIKEHQPRFLYTVPSFQNPTGICATHQRRQEVLDLAARYDLPIVEDDTYGALDYDDERPVSLKSMDRHGQVTYLGGFSKVLMPGLRIGYMVLPPEFRERLVSLRQALDLSGPLLPQRTLANFLRRGRFKVHMRRVLPHYRARRDELLSAMEQLMPEQVTWTRPHGGFCSWITLPNEQRYQNLYHIALEHGVAFTPGEAFLIRPDDAIHLRFCFSKEPPEVIREGVEILAQLLRNDSQVYHFKRSLLRQPMV